MPRVIVDLSTHEAFPQEWAVLGDEERQRLGAFLRELQRSPYSPAVQQECAMDESEIYAFPISEEFVLYWSIAEVQRGSTGTLSVDSICVRLLGIERIDGAKREPW